MKDEYYIARKCEMDRFFKIKDHLCHEKKCVFSCTDIQKKACLDYYWMLAMGDDELNEVMK